jgi:hypothetical protein
MQKDELIKIVIAAAVAVTLKELLSWLTRSTMPIAKTLAKIMGSWMLNHVNALQFAIDAFFVIWWVNLFFQLPEMDSPVTHDSVRFQFILALAVVVQTYHAKKSFKRWKNNDDT